MAKLSISDAARVTGVSRQTLYRYLHAGKLRQQADGLVDTADLSAAGLVLHPVTLESSSDKMSPVTPTVTPVTPGPIVPELDYQGRYITRLERDVDRLEEEVATLREAVRSKDALLQEYQSQVFQLFQEQHRLLQQVQQPRLAGPTPVSAPLPADYRGFMRQRVLQAMQAIPEGCTRRELERAVGAPKALTNVLQGMRRDGLIVVVERGVYALPVIE